MGMAVKIVGIILILVGIFYAGAPHSTHTSSGIGFGWEHTMHIILGVVLIVIGLVLIFALGRKKGGKGAAQQAAKAGAKPSAEVPAAE